MTVEITYPTQNDINTTLRDDPTMTPLKHKIAFLGLIKSLRLETGSDESEHRNISDDNGVARFVITTADQLSISPHHQQKARSLGVTLPESVTVQTPNQPVVEAVMAATPANIEQPQDQPLVGADLPVGPPVTPQHQPIVEPVMAATPANIEQPQDQPLVGADLPVGPPVTPQHQPVVEPVRVATPVNIEQPQDQPIVEPPVMAATPANIEPPQEQPLVGADLPVGPPQHQPVVEAVMAAAPANIEQPQEQPLVGADLPVGPQVLPPPPTAITTPPPPVSPASRTTSPQNGLFNNMVNSILGGLDTITANIFNLSGVSTAPTTDHSHLNPLASSSVFTTVPVRPVSPQSTHSDPSYFRVGEDDPEQSSPELAGQTSPFTNVVINTNNIGGSLSPILETLDPTKEEETKASIEQAVTESLRTTSSPVSLLQAFNTFHPLTPPVRSRRTSPSHSRTSPSQTSSSSSRRSIFLTASHPTTTVMQLMQEQEDVKRRRESDASDHGWQIVPPAAPSSTQNISISSGIVPLSLTSIPSATTPEPGQSKPPSPHSAQRDPGDGNDAENSDWNAITVQPGRSPQLSAVPVEGLATANIQAEASSIRNRSDVGVNVNSSNREQGSRTPDSDSLSEFGNISTPARLSPRDPGHSISSDSLAIPHSVVPSQIAAPSQLSSSVSVHPSQNSGLQQALQDRLARLQEEQKRGAENTAQGSSSVRLSSSGRPRSFSSDAVRAEGIIDPNQLDFSPVLGWSRVSARGAHAAGVSSDEVSPVLVSVTPPTEANSDDDLEHGVDVAKYFNPGKR